MTKLWIQSDQHYEIYGKPLVFPIPEADVFVCAGDLMREPADAVMWLDVTVPFPTIYVAGNHEYYRGVYTKWRDEGAAASAERPKVDLLENSFSIAGGVRFIGCTLWTDYALYGEDRVEEAMRHAATGLNDFNHIDYGILDRWRRARFLPSHQLRIHQESRAFLEQALQEPFSGKTVVVTHHGPHPGSVHPRYANDLLTAAFVSDLSGLIERTQPDLWIHGHVHSSFDYMVGKTRVIANPKGYANENPDFDPALVIEI
ncbi:hypothetical protein GFM44_23150 [Rhizobium leguminosarum bv. viciae]|nr:hypothetical protein [Rhizobium leguminosarum bv. viciae]